MITKRKRTADEHSENDLSVNQNDSVQESVLALQPFLSGPQRQANEITGQGEDSSDSDRPGNEQSFVDRFRICWFRFWVSL